MMPGRLRPLTTAIINIFYGLGLALMALMCGTVTYSWDWRLEVLVWSCLPVTALLVLGIPMVHESLRFLVGSGRLPEARRVAARIVATNGLDWPQGIEGLGAEPSAAFCANAASDSFLSAQDEDVTVTTSGRSCRCGGRRGEVGPCRLLLKPRYLIRTVALMVCWVGGSASYYGLTFIAGNLSRDLYTNIVLLALVDAVSWLLPAVLMPVLGRLGTLRLSFVLAGVTLGLCTLLHHGSKLLLGMVLLGRAANDIAFLTTFVVAVEIFPTECRATALGVSQFGGRLCSALAPLLSLVPARTACFIFGGLSLAAAAACTLAMPETGGQGMDDVASVATATEAGVSVCRPHCSSEMADA
eukprot:gnl/TRDRNA2_/TRDRNA2_142238_c0_seq1.p1 gnl/TRDRNA2_/TRDRNA2_142238_c0~~gnl/TRDRNA2_/TRDRNA2_142238_c0_seq1.p1  ORF type:complete len:391 (+),score=38.98 gnl/TRDRNA2_/TRDRNA2_142238_c0_seq1:107-1174(+)